jgi:hypothetical protein
MQAFGCCDENIGNHYYTLVLNHSANDSVLDFAVMQVDADFIADSELSIVLRLFVGWHARECTPEEDISQDHLAQTQM